MKQLQPVIWTKGTFLTPQHLQVQDRFIEDTLSFRLQTLKFCAWGFSELTLNQEMLTEGQLVVSRAAGIFPDGLLFDIPDADSPPPSKALAELFEPGMKSLDIYLTVPDYRQRGLNVAAEPDGSSRYVVEETTFRDENTGAGDKPLQIARKNLRLLAENENREGCSVLRIANVELTDAGTFRLNPRFIPPLLEISASEYLLGLLRGLVEMMSARSSQLASRDGRRTKAWLISPLPISRTSGCCTPSIPTFQFSTIYFRAKIAIPRNCIPPWLRWPARSPPFRPSCARAICPCTHMIRWDRCLPTWTRNSAPCWKP